MNVPARLDSLLMLQILQTVKVMHYFVVIFCNNTCLCCPCHALLELLTPEEHELSDIEKCYTILNKTVQLDLTPLLELIANDPPPI